jgi:dipeptidyl aminopeptidase/acylaminoacyl peptidase
MKSIYKITPTQPIPFVSYPPNFTSMKKWMALLWAFAICFTAAAQSDGYKTPPQVLADLLLAPPTPGTSINDAGTVLLLSDRSSYPTVEDLAQPELRIAGLRLNPNNYGQSRASYTTNYRLQNLATNQIVQVKGLPANLKAVGTTWNNSQTKIAFAHYTKTGIDIYVIDVATATAQKVNKTAANFTMGNRLGWENDQTLYYATALKPASAAPPRPLAPTGPVVQQNLGKTAASRTFQDLIKNSYDEQLFAFYATAQMVRNTNGTETKIGAPAIFGSFDFSPDGNYIYAEKYNQPFSYLVPANGFAATHYIADKNGKQVKLLANNPSYETAPIGYDNVQDVPSGFEWHPSKPATIIYSQPLDSGIYKKRNDYHDAVYSLEAPFAGQPKELFKTSYRFNNIDFGNETINLVAEVLQAKQKVKISIWNEQSNSYTLLSERSLNDAYNNPGSPVKHKNKYGNSVIQFVDGGRAMLLTGQGASAKGDLPFLNKYNFDSKETKTIWRCEEPYYETVLKVLDANKDKFVTSKQSLAEPANLYIRQNGTASKITDFKDPQPAMRKVKKEKIFYKRNDGVDLTATVYYPENFTPGVDKPLPIFMWAYPREFKSNADAAQVRGSQYNFTTVGWGSPVFLAANGYCVMDNTEFPIVGEGDKEPNDNFIEQLVANAQAALNKIHELKIGDTARAAVGGHSYGAFMTANLLAHSRLFKAGIARSGAYNRTLTPFGFQNEQRTYWQAPDVYNKMSPFSHANKIKDALLLIHGEADNNPGTFPIQSERLYNAIKGHGGTVRYVQLPYESHSYAAKENLLHMLWEMNSWLDKYLKK